MAITQETMMEVIVAGQDAMRKLFALQRAIREGAEEQDWGRLLFISQSCSPDGEGVATLARLEQYYLMAKHKNNYNRRRNARLAGREERPIEYPKGFGDGRLVKVQHTTPPGFRKAQEPEVIRYMDEEMPEAPTFETLFPKSKTDELFDENGNLK